MMQKQKTVRPQRAMTEIEAIVEALTCFDGAEAARIDWDPLFPDWESPVRQRYVHKTRTVAAGVRCPEGRPGCYQEVRENAETGEWRAVCSRDSEECARRTLTQQQATVWSLDVQALCQDIAESLKTGGAPQEWCKGIWECGKVRLPDGRRVAVLLVLGGDGFSERLESVRELYDGAGVVFPSYDRATDGQQMLCEGNGSVVLGIAERCRVVEDGRIVTDSLEGWTGTLAGIHGTGTPAAGLMDTPRGISAVGGQMDGGDETKPPIAAAGLFVPVTIKWNNEPFVVELAPKCFKGYALDEVSLEDYFPELHDNPEARRDLPWEEIEKLHIMTLVGAEATLEIQLLLDSPTIFVPSSVQATGDGLGKHNDGAFVVSGKAYPMVRCTVTETETDKKALIKANRAALKHADQEGAGKGSHVAQGGVYATMPETVPGGPGMNELIAVLAKHTESLGSIYEHVKHIPEIGDGIAAIRNAKGGSGAIGNAGQRAKTPRKRASRTVTIDGIKKLLRDHLRAARDHAHDSLKRKGVAELLPRPTQPYLAAQLKVDTSSVSRAIRDKADKEILILWQTASNIDQVLKFKG